jgi:tetratricopeptide (TPR) repeat protein
MDYLQEIDRYFQAPVSEEESRNFAKRIENDPHFAEEVAFYLGAYGAGAAINAEQKKQIFKEIYNQLPKEKKPLRSAPSPIRRLIPYLTAAALVSGIIIRSLVISPTLTQELANNYIKAHLQTLDGVKMGPTDSLQRGVSLYNEGRFNEALEVFENMVKKDPSNYTAVENAGLSALRMGDYDKALLYFRKLQSFTTLHINPALVYQALTLMKRNRPGDTRTATQLLRQAEQDQNMKQDAEELLKK